MGSVSEFEVAGLQELALSNFCFGYSREAVQQYVVLFWGGFWVPHTRGLGFRV